MVSVVVEREISSSAEKVWGLLKDFGDISWAGMNNVEVYGEGVGTIRKIIVGEGQFAEERLEHYDADGMTFTYSIISGNQLPIDDLQGTPKVSPIDSDHCLLSWTLRGVEAGVAESEAEHLLTGFYSGLLDIVANAVMTRE